MSPATWLLFIDDTVPQQVLCTHLTERGHKVVVVSRCETMAAYQGAVSQSKPDHIVFWASDHFDLQSLLCLAQVLDTITCAVHLDVITQRAYAVGPGEPINLQQSGLGGMVPVIAQEYPLVTSRTIDVAMPEDYALAAASCARVVEELQLPSSSSSIAYRGSQRWVPAFVPLTPPSGENAPLRQGGTYLITGGFGRIARTLARHLAKVYQAQLILVARTPLPARILWDQPHDSEIVNDRIRFVRELEAAGAHVYPFAADVADAVQMQQVLTEVTQTVGAVHGVLHTAAVVGADTAVLLPEITPEIMAKQWRAKVQGAQVLAQLLRDRTLDFCALFSSTSAWLGGLGFAVYAAANRHLDALATVQSQQQHTLWLSINWDGWQFDADAQPVTWGQELADLAISETEGVQAFVQALALRFGPQLIISPGDWQSRYETCIVKQTTAGPTLPSLDLQERPQVETTYVAPYNELEIGLATIWQALLGVKQVGIHDNFFDLGGHSLLAVQLAQAIRQIFGCELSLRVLFAAPTVAEMATAIAMQQWGDDIDEQELEALLQEVEEMPEENQAHQ
jgi:NAD(P)-dependent dehydrogenase (short-subunit alcohol dehydrogenase family)